MHTLQLQSCSSQLSQILPLGPPASASCVLFAFQVSATCLQPCSSLTRYVSIADHCQNLVLPCDDLEICRVSKRIPPSCERRESFCSLHKCLEESLDDVNNLTCKQEAVDATHVDLLNFGNCHWSCNTRMHARRHHAAAVQLYIPYDGMRTSAMPAKRAAYCMHQNYHLHAVPQ